MVNDSELSFIYEIMLKKLKKDGYIEGIEDLSERTQDYENGMRTVSRCLEELRQKDKVIESLQERINDIESEVYNIKRWRNQDDK